MSRVDRALASLFGVRCALVGHRWERARMSVGESEEGFAKPVVWQPRRVCDFCGSVEVEVGFPSSIGTVESSRIVVADWPD